MVEQDTETEVREACSAKWSKAIERYADAIYQGDLSWRQLCEIFANLFAHEKECDQCNEAKGRATFKALEMRVNRSRSHPLSGEELLQEVLALYNSVLAPE